MDWWSSPQIYIVTLLVILVGIYLFISNGGYKNLPPGPRGVPILGYLPYMKPRIFFGTQRLMKEYGDVVLFYLGMRRVVLLNSPEVIKEAFTTKGENFGGRLHVALTRKKPNVGILTAEGEIWRVHRRFSLRVLKDFGFGRNLSEQNINSELRHLKEVLDTKLGESINSNDLLTRSVGNVICTITMGEQPGYEDEDFEPVINGIKDNIRAPFFTRLPILFPFLTNFSFLIKLLPTFRKRQRNLDNCLKYIKSKITVHRNRFNPDSEAEDLIDAYLLEQHRLQQTGEDNSFTDEQLVRVIFELFLAGTDTTSNTLTWLLLLMSLHPEIQTRVQAEINGQMDRSRAPSMKDRREMPYTCAVIDEIQRFASIVPQASHRNFREDTIKGFTVPADSQIMANIYGIHHDPRLWQYPDRFYPEHFLNSQGEYKPSENLIPFLLGKRVCLGESLAKMEMFLFFVGIMQIYTVSLKDSDKDNMDYIMLGLEGVVRPPGIHSIIFTHHSDVSD